jgi:transcriptional regulator with XRE-family HTH domain
VQDDDMAAQPTPYAEVIAANVRAERKRAGLSQVSVAQRMRQLGYRWHFQSVGAVERGERRLTAEEVLALSLALEVTMDDLMLAPRDGQWVALPGGQVIGLPAGRRLPYPPEWASAWDGDQSKLSSEPIPAGKENDGKDQDSGAGQR